MKLFILLFIIFYTSLFSSNLDYLLEEYDSTSEKSLQTVDEKLGHVYIYSQKDIKLMQYNKLNDILKELPLLNLNKNRYGLSSLSLSGTNTTVSGFFRVFINDHEVSSLYNQSAAVSWGDLPLDFIDYVEIYALPELKPVAAPMAGSNLLAVAVKFGTTRLIDNVVLEEK